MAIWDTTTLSPVAEQILKRLVAEEIRRLPALPPHGVCGNCGFHAGTLTLPITGTALGCAWCHFGAATAKEARENYPETYAEMDTAVTKVAGIKEVPNVGG